jgi:hypothetical protein
MRSAFATLTLLLASTPGAGTARAGHIHISSPNGAGAGAPGSAIEAAIDGPGSHFVPDFGGDTFSRCRRPGYIFEARLIGGPGDRSVIDAGAFAVYDSAGLMIGAGPISMSDEALANDGAGMPFVLDMSSIARFSAAPSPPAADLIAGFESFWLGASHRPAVVSAPGSRSLASGTTVLFVLGSGVLGLGFLGAGHLGAWGRAWGSDRRSEGDRTAPAGVIGDELGRPESTARRKIDDGRVPMVFLVMRGQFVPVGDAGLFEDRPDLRQGVRWIG